MRLYNTLTRSVEDVSPINPPLVTLYTCGPTVYDYQHIGNYIAYVRWDLLARTLRANDFEVDWYMNITDVGHLVSDGDEGEDKLEKGAAREGKTAWQVADFYLADFLSNIEALNLVIPKDHFVRATDYIPDQIALIEKLEAKGHTYVIKDGVYFDSTSFPNYGQMAKLDIEGLQSGARVDVGDKKHPTDFALWKLSPKGTKRDMEWESPWGKGFPGWHIECSALAMKFLGTTIDIHAGGIDHIPVHHTNEIAQSEAATGEQFVKIWVHGNFLQVDGQKISKSLSNGYTLKDLAEKGYTPQDFRMFVLQSHYRTEAHFTFDNLQAAQNRRKTIQAWADLRFQPVEEIKSSGQLENGLKRMLDALSNDLNTAEALKELNEIIGSTQSIHINEVEDFKAALDYIDSLLGLELTKSTDLSDEQKELISSRESAREEKNWQESDRIREELTKQGIGLKDLDNNQVWYRL